MTNVVCDSGPLTHLWQIGWWPAFGTFDAIHVAAQVAQEVRLHVSLDQMRKSVVPHQLLVALRVVPLGRRSRGHMHPRSLGRARDRIAAVGPHGPEVGVAVGAGVGVGMVPLSAPGVAHAGATAPTASSSKNTTKMTRGAH